MFEYIRGAPKLLRQSVESRVFAMFSWQWPPGKIYPGFTLLQAGKKVYSHSGFRGKGFKFDETEAQLADERKKIQKAALGLQDSDDEDAGKDVSLKVNPLWPSDAIWRYRSVSTLAQVMACCLTAHSAYSFEIPQPSVTEIGLKVTNLKFQSDLSGTNELRYWEMIYR